MTGAPWAVSVVVPALDEAATIRRCVRSILVAGSAGQICVDVTVVADRCRDRTAAAALEALEGRGRVVEIDVGSVGAGRRIGVDLALMALAGRGHPLERTWLLATDADSTVPPDWVTAHLRHAEAGAHAVAGIVVVDSFRDHHASVETAFRGRYEIGATGEHRHVHGTNLGLRGDAYRAVGGWRDLATGEDHDLWRRLQRSGAPLVSTIAAPVRTSGRAFGRAPHGFAHLLRSLAPSGGADELAR